MANEITRDTEAVTAIADLWPTLALKARFAKEVVAPRVKNVFDNVPFKKGGTVQVQIMPAVSLGNVGNDGQVANTAATLTEAVITINSWRYAKVDITDEAQALASVDLMDQFAQQFGESLAEDYDNSLLGLHGSFTTNTPVGGNNALDDSVCLEAVIVLDNAKVPMTDRTWAFSPRAKADLLHMDKFGSAAISGGDTSRLLNGQFGELYGNPVVISPLVASSGGAYQNIYFHKEAMGLGTQWKSKIEKLARTQLSTPIVGHSLYGFGVIRNGHAIVVRNAA